MKEYTDQKFFYKAVPVDYDGVARLKRIKGNTLAFNQLLPTTWASSGSGNGVTFTNNGNGSYTFNGTSTGTTFIPRSITITAKANHKYFVNVGNNSNTGLNITINGLGEEYYVKTKGIISSPTDNNFVLFYQTGASFNNLKVWPQVIDLTAMFGSGNEPSTVEEFTSLFPLSYYSYQSTLLPFKGTSIKTLGKNQIDATQAQSNGLSTMETSEGTVHGVYTGSGTFAGFNFLRNPNFTNTHLKGKYRLSFDAQGITSQWTIGLRRGVSFIGGIAYNTWIYEDGHYSFTIDTTGQEDCYISFSRTSGTGDMDFTFSNIQLELGETETSYEPYTSHTTNLPITTYFPNGMKSAGTVYDELLPNKAITRVGMVDLGSLNYARTTTQTSGVYRFIGSGLPSDTKRPSANNVVANMSSIYQSVTMESVYFGTAPNMSISISAEGTIQLRNDSYTTPEALKSAMSNVYLFYELSTPVETEINEDIFYRFYQYGTEQILPVNGATPTTAPIWCDIEYYNQIESEIPYRKFWLVNGNGEKWNLTEKEIKSFLNNPSGLGFRKSIEITRYGEKANKINEVYDFPQPQGELLFYDSVNSSRYDKYYEFTRFVMNQPITLYYQIPVSYNSMIADTYKLDCEVTELQKTESKPDRIMTTQIVFSGLGFYEGEEIEINGTGTTYTIENKGDFPVGFEITLEGSLMNPYITLSQDGEMYGEAKFDDTTAFSSVYVDSKDGEQNVVLKQSGSILPNPLSYQDLSISNGSIYVTFVKLLRGVTELTIGRRSGSLTSVKIKYSPKYRSV